MAIWSAVWPKETGKTYHSVPLSEGTGKGLFSKAPFQQLLYVLHSNPAASGLGKGWAAIDDFQQCSMEKHVANTESEAPRLSEIQHKTRQLPFPGTRILSSYERIMTTIHVRDYAACVLLTGPDPTIRIHFLIAICYFFFTFRCAF